MHGIALTDPYYQRYHEFTEILVLTTQLTNLGFYTWNVENMPDESREDMNITCAKEWALVCPRLRWITFLDGMVLERHSDHLCQDWEVSGW